MAISSEVRRAGPFKGDGVQTLFEFEFTVFQPDEVAPYISTDGGATEAALNADLFSISLNSDQDMSPGGTVTLKTPLAEGTTLSILSAVPYLQSMVLTNRGGFYPSQLNESADRCVILAQQNREMLERAFMVPVTSEKTPSELLSDVMSAKVSADKVIPHIPSIETAAGAIDKITTVADNVDAILASERNAESAKESAELAKENADRSEAAAEAAVVQLHAVSYEAQALKQTERIQAKANIGADYFVNVKDFGAKGDGISDDTAAIQAAINYAAVKGCRAFLPATGAAYVTTRSITVPRGVTVFGDSHNGPNRLGASNSEYAKVGTTINPKGKDGSAFILAENGASIRGIQFIHDQPVPLDESWAPTQYPYCIEARASWHTIKEITIVNGSHGIWLSYTPEAPGGTQVTIDDCRIGALEVGLRHDSVTDTLSITRVNFGPCWHIDTKYVKEYRHKHTIGWSLGHGSGTYATGIEFYRLHTAMKLRSLPNNVGADTGPRASRFDNILFNLVNRAVDIESTTIWTELNFGTVFAQSADDWGLALGSDPLFNFQSDNLDVNISLLVVGTCGGSVCRLGAGSGGGLSITNLCVRDYSTQASGQSAFFLASGARLKLGAYTIKRSKSTAGAYFSGAGSRYVTTGSKQCRIFFPTFNALKITGDNERNHITTSDPRIPSQEGWTQIRLFVEVNVVTSKGVGAKFDFCGVTVTVDTSSTGWKTSDSGWVDIQPGSLDTEAGRLYVTAPNGSELSTGTIFVQWR